MKLMQTWNTWDVRCLNAVMKVPDMAEVRVAVYDERDKFYTDEFLWANVERFGYHHPEGKYFDIDLKLKDLVFNMEFASEGGVFVYKISPVKNRPRVKLFAAGLFRWNAPGSVEKSDNELVMKSKAGSYKISVYGKIDNESPVNTSYQGILADFSQPVYIRCNNEMNEAEMEDFIAEKKKQYMDELVQGGGVLEDAPEAVIKGVVWNTIYEPIKKRFCTPVSRAWCTANGSGFGSYVLFDWDTFFAGLLSSIQDKELAYQQVYSILQEMTPGGMVPNFGAQSASSYDRSQPPVGAYCVLKLYKQFGEKELLEKTFDKFMIWNRWWMRHRDGNGDGLLEWGSDFYPEVSRLGFESHNLQAAKYESGLDNSPMYDDTIFNEKSHTMELVDVGLNALYAMDCWALAEIADILGKNSSAEELRKEYSRVSDLINNELWNEELGIYCNKHWNGEFSTCLTPTNFYPLIAGVATEERAQRMIEEHLLNEKEFWGEFVIPSVSKKEPSFQDNNYWRGRIWGPMNFLVSEGIKRYGYHEVSYDFSRKSLNLFLKEWKEENHIHENYNAVTGDGDDRNNADPVYTWGGLLGYTAISELIEVQPWKGLKFGNLSEDQATVTNFVYGSDRYSVTKESGITVVKNGNKLIESSMPVIISGFSEDSGQIRFDVENKTEGTLTIYTAQGVEKIVVRKVGEENTYYTENRDEVKISL